MEQIIPVIIILLTFWVITNIILKNILGEYQDLNDFSISILKYRKTIMFDIIVLIFFVFFDFSFIKWIATIYYIIIGTLEGILLIISFFTGIDDDVKNRNIDKDLWKVFIAKLLNEISTIIMILTLI